jgi:glycosyltransferase involved in cell wall biosynthesis
VFLRVKSPVLRLVLLTMGIYPDNIRGGGRYAYGLYLLVRNSFETHVLTTRERTKIQLPGVEQLDLPWSVSSNTNSIRFVLAWVAFVLKSIMFIARWKPSIIHATNVYEAVAPIILKRKFIVTIHDGSAFAIGRISKPLAYLSLKKAGLILVPTSAVRDYIGRNVIDITKIQAPVFILSNYVSKSEFDKLSRNAATSVGIDHKLVILFVGAISRPKGVPALIEAFRGIDADVTLLLVGPLSDPSLIRDMPTNVKYVGMVSRDRLLSYYGLAKMVVAPSIGSEGQGIVLLEAMAAGKPLVVGDIPVFREVAKEAAIYVDGSNPVAIRQAILRVLNDQTLCEQMCNESHNVFAKSGDVAEQYLGILRRFANAQGR